MAARFPAGRGVRDKTPPGEEKGTERASGSAPVVLQRLPSGRRMHNANDPTLFSLFAFLGLFWLGFFVCDFFFSFFPPPQRMCVCLYSYFFLLLLPKRPPSPLTSAPFWLFQFTGSCPAPSTEKSEENVHLRPDFYHTPTGRSLEDILSISL